MSFAISSSGCATISLTGLFKDTIYNIPSPQYGVINHYMVNPGIYSTLPDYRECYVPNSTLVIDTRLFAGEFVPKNGKMVRVGKVPVAVIRVRNYETVRFVNHYTAQCSDLSLFIFGVRNVVNYPDTNTLVITANNPKRNQCFGECGCSRLDACQCVEHLIETTKRVNISKCKKDRKISKHRTLVTCGVNLSYSHLYNVSYLGMVSGDIAIVPLTMNICMLVDVFINSTNINARKSTIANMQLYKCIYPTNTQLYTILGKLQISNMTIPPIIVTPASIQIDKCRLSRIPYGIKHYEFKNTHEQIPKPLNCLSIIIYNCQPFFLDSDNSHKVEHLILIGAGIVLVNSILGMFTVSELTLIDCQLDSPLHIIAINHLKLVNCDGAPTICGHSNLEINCSGKNTYLIVGGTDKVTADCSVMYIKPLLTESGLDPLFGE